MSRIDSIVVRFTLSLLLVTVACVGFDRADAAPTRPPGMPPNAVRVSPCVPTMGEHWADPKTLPEGPFYGVARGRIVFTELMIDQRNFASGKSWHDVLKPLAGHRIDHVDIDFQPHGHPGYRVPHYDVHAYYVTHATHQKFCT